MYAELRKTNPVCQVGPLGWWAITRYADIQYVLKHPEIFSSTGFRQLWLPPWVEKNPHVESMWHMDPPEHTKLRSLVNRAFVFNIVARLEPRARAVAEDLAKRIEPGTEADLIAVFANPMPAIVIAELLGLDPARYEDFGHWMYTFGQISPVTPEPKREPIRKTLAEMAECIQSVINERKKTPREDMISDLLRAEVDGNRLSDREIVAFVVLLLSAGMETIRNIIANSVFFLTTAPELTKQLRANPASIQKFVEEMLRYDGPVEIVIRKVISNTEVGGVSIPEGSYVACMMSSGNRDESQFPNPHQFDLNRDAQGTLSFGHGVHLCIGPNLGRMETRVALETLLARFGGFAQAPGEIEWNPSMVTRGPTRLPIRFLPA